MVAQTTAVRLSAGCHPVQPRVRRRYSALVHVRGRARSRAAGDGQRLVRTWSAVGPHFAEQGHQPAARRSLDGPVARLAGATRAAQSAERTLRRAAASTLRSELRARSRNGGGAGDRAAELVRQIGEQFDAPTESVRGIAARAPVGLRRVSTRDRQCTC